MISIGTVDGHLLEYRSVPLNRLEADVAASGHLSGHINNNTDPHSQRLYQSELIVGNSVLLTAVPGALSIKDPTGTEYAEISVKAVNIIGGGINQISRTDLNIEDAFVVLNSNLNSGTPVLDSGILIKRGDKAPLQLYWNESTNRWRVQQQNALGTLEEFDLAHLGNIYTRAESEDRFVNIAGDTMTGQLAISPIGTGALLLNSATQGTDVRIGFNNNGKASNIIANSGVLSIDAYDSVQASSPFRVYSSGGHYVEINSYDTADPQFDTSKAAFYFNKKTFAPGFDAQANCITNIADPMVSSDAVNLGFADLKYFNVSGDTIHGNLTLEGTPYFEQGFIYLNHQTVPVDAGLIIHRSGVSPTIFFQESTQRWRLGFDNDNSFVITEANLNNTTNSQTIRDLVGAMVSGSTQSGVSVTYAWDKLNFDVHDPVLTLSGDVSGSATMTDLGDTDITVTVHDDSHSHTAATISDFAANIQDTVGAMVSGNTETGIAVTYDSAAKKLNFDVHDPVLTLSGDVSGSAIMTNLGDTDITVTVHDDSHSHTAATISDFAANIQDTVGAMVSGNTETGIAVTYDSAAKKLNFDVHDPVLTFTGAVTGSAIMTNLGSVSIVTTTNHALATHTDCEGYSNINPLMSGVVAQGTANRLSRQDHRHPTDTTRAAVGHSHGGAEAFVIGRYLGTFGATAANRTNITLLAPLPSSYDVFVMPTTNSIGALANIGAISVFRSASNFDVYNTGLSGEGFMAVLIGTPV